jgi:hypothetical protein
MYAKVPVRERPWDRMTTGLGDTQVGGSSMELFADRELLRVDAYIRFHPTTFQRCLHTESPCVSCYSRTM